MGVATAADVDSNSSRVPSLVLPEPRDADVRASTTLQDVNASEAVTQDFGKGALAWMHVGIAYLAKQRGDNAAEAEAVRTLLKIVDG